MQIIHQAPLAALGLGAAFTVVWGVADPVAAFAEVRVIEADGYYIMGDGPEENAAVAKERARADARRAASEQAGLYVAGMTEVKKGKLTRDEIRTISVAVMEVKEDNVTPEVGGHGDPVPLPHESRGGHRQHHRPTAAGQGRTGGSGTAQYGA
ncbi:hypothetical protein [Selenomonas sp. KH1T6]|uniref:hypothetical protein n=1 Tax=Selenomonas sp. KH1T6 TaxID=3158784 RepID=UPI0009438B03